MSATWTRLLDSDSQPVSLRESYELLEAFVVALREPTRVDDAALASEPAARLGYLISAARLLAGAQTHDSWTRLGTRLRERLPVAPHPSDVVLLRADNDHNSLDDLARAWGFRKGVDPRKMKEIVTYAAT